MKGVGFMQITKRTIASTIINLIALINAIMVMIGKPVLVISDSQVGVIVSVIFTIVAWVYGFWKNNSFTPEAIKADDYLDLLRNEEMKDAYEVYHDEDDEEPKEWDDEDITEGDE